MHPFANKHTTGLFPARIKRTAFLFRGSALLLAGFLASLLISASEYADLLSKIVCVGGGIALLLFVLVATFRSLLMPRLVDVGVHPAWSLLFLVHALSGPFLLGLLLIPSNAFAKRRYIA